MEGYFPCWKGSDPMQRWRFAFLKAVLGLVILCGTARPSLAIVGTVDTTNQYPFVVQLQITYRDGSGASCSGVVFGHVLSTAAHCLYEVNGSSPGYATRVSVSYQDALGERRTAFARRLYVPQEYVVAEKRVNDGPSGYKAATHDVGYAVLNENVLVPGYLHWGLELLEGLPDGKSDCAEPECMDWSLIDQRRTGFLANLKKYVGDLHDVDVLIVGYGYFECKEREVQNTCKMDGRRRFATMKLDLTRSSYKPPWLWCTGRGTAGINPVEHGDSGGPVFIKALDGRWIYVGYVSRGNDYGDCSSSMFNNLNTWVKAASAYDASQVSQPLANSTDAEIDAWHRSVAGQFVREWIQYQNAEPDVVLGSLSRMYDVGPGAGWKTVDYFGAKRNYDFIYRDKQHYVERWPKRHFALSSQWYMSIDCTDTPSHGTDTCTVLVPLDWSVASPDRNEIKKGSSVTRLTLGMPFFFTKSLLLLDFTPKILSEGTDTVSHNDPGAAGGEKIRSVKSNISLGYANMRSGAGTNFPVVARIPAGQSLQANMAKCTRAMDGRSRYPWCPVIWHGLKGWVSSSGFK
jgi:hypothetical protein